MSVIKITGTEAACNTTPSNFGNASHVKLWNEATARREVTYEEVVSVLTVTVNATANATTLLPITAGDPYPIYPGDLIKYSTNTAVVNTGIASEVSSGNTTAIVSNVDIVEASGETDLTIVRAVSTTSIGGNAELIVAKSPKDVLSSNSDTEVFGTPVGVRG